VPCPAIGWGGGLSNFLLGLDLNLSPLGLSIPSNYYYRYEPLALGLCWFLFTAVQHSVMWKDHSLFSSLLMEIYWWLFPFCCKDTIVIGMCKFIQNNPFVSPTCVFFNYLVSLTSFLFILTLYVSQLFITIVKYLRCTNFMRKQLI
jgi:hypothetical protein